MSIRLLKNESPLLQSEHPLLQGEPPPSNNPLLQSEPSLHYRVSFHNFSKSHYGWEIKNNMHIHCSVAAGSGLGRSQMYTIQVHPFEKQQVDWIPSYLTEGEGAGALGWRGTGLALHIISHGPGRAEIHSTPASFVWHIEYNCTLDGSVRTAYTWIFSCRAQDKSSMAHLGTYTTSALGAEKGCHEISKEMSSL